MAAETQEINKLILPPPTSLTLGEIENKLVYIEEKQASEEEARIIHNFIEHKGLLFKWIRIPTKYFERYASSKRIESNSTLHASNTLNESLMEIVSKYASQLQKIWNVASPLNDSTASNHLVFKYNPSITQQIHSDYSMNNSYAPSNANNIIKFDYHPLHRQMVIAFKNGICFFDMKRNCWLGRVLHHESQLDITDFAFSDCGLHLAVTCAKGVFIWNLRERKGELMNGSRACAHKWDRVLYSPCLKYMAVYAVQSHCVEIYDLYCNKMVYRHSIFHRIMEIQWIPSTKENKYCPLRLLFVTDSSYLFLLNMVSFKTESFQCKVSQHKVSQVSVSKNGNGIIAVTANRDLYYISMKQFSEPQHLADLYLENRYQIEKIKWSPCDRRIAIIYRDSIKNEIARFVSIWAYDFATPYSLGYITNPQKDTFPVEVTFRNHFNCGALLAICWNNAIISQHHLCFHR